VGTALFDFAERIDILMIGFYLDEADVGIYSAASSIARFLLIFTASTMPVVATLAAEAAGRGTVHEMGRLQRTTTRWMLFFTGPLAAGLLLYPEEAILFLFGGEFAGGASSLRILVLASLVPILTGPIGLLLDALGKTRWTLANVFFRLVINFSLNLLLIPRFGISGAACGTLAALAIAAIFQWIQLAKLVPLAGNYRGWGVPLAALAGSAALSFGSHWALSSILPGETGRILSALISGAILVLCFGFAVRRIPGCLEDADREVIRLVWNRARFTGGLSGRR
jgi:O-antigen/teichoic acid export membrane protein